MLSNSWTNDSYEALSVINSAINDVRFLHKWINNIQRSVLWFLNEFLLFISSLSWTKKMKKAFMSRLCLLRTVIIYCIFWFQKGWLLWASSFLCRNSKQHNHWSPILTGMTLTSQFLLVNKKCIAQSVESDRNVKEWLIFRESTTFKIVIKMWTLTFIALELYSICSLFVIQYLVC